jgi:hypothetical protein
MAKGKSSLKKGKSSSKVGVEKKDKAPKKAKQTSVKVKKGKSSKKAAGEPSEKDAAASLKKKAAAEKKKAAEQKKKQAKADKEEKKKVKEATKKLAKEIKDASKKLKKWQTARTKEAAKELLLQKPFSARMLRAAEGGWTPNVDHWIKAGANVDDFGPDGETALMHAARWGHVETVQALLNAGANPDVQSETEGFSALWKAASVNEYVVVQLLIAAGADPDGQSGFGDTPLNYAVREHHLETVQILLSGGADTDIQNSLGQTPLISAVSQGYADMVQLLLAYGSVDANDATGRFAQDVANAASYDNGISELLEKANAVAPSEKPFSLVNKNVRLEKPMKFKKDRHGRKNWLDTCVINDFSVGRYVTKFAVKFDCDRDHCPALKKRFWNKVVDKDPNWKKTEKKIWLRSQAERISGRNFTVLKRLHGPDYQVPLPILNCGLLVGAGALQVDTWVTELGPPPPPKEKTKKGKGGAAKGKGKGGAAKDKKKGGKKPSIKKAKPKASAKPKGSAKKKKK